MMCHCLLTSFPANSLEKDLEEFLKSTGQDCCDITLVLDETSIPAHKAILAARCTYFESMFRSFMPESNSVKVHFVFVAFRSWHFYGIVSTLNFVGSMTNLIQTFKPFVKNDTCFVAHSCKNKILCFGGISEACLLLQVVKCARFVS